MKFKAFNEEEFKRDTDTIDLTNLEIVEEAIATLQESYFNKNDGFRRIEKVSLLAIHLLQQENQQLKEVIEEVISIAYKYGQIDGSHHKLWVIDQMLRLLLGEKYQDFIKDYEENGEYTWDTGIAP